MDWLAWVLLAVLALGLAAGVALAVRAWLTNPVVIAGYTAALATIAMRAFLKLLPGIVAYLAKRMPPEEEAEWRAAERAGRGAEWLKERAQRRRRERGARQP